MGGEVVSVTVFIKWLKSCTNLLLCKCAQLTKLSILSGFRDVNGVSHVPTTSTTSTSSTSSSCSCSSLSTQEETVSDYSQQQESCRGEPHRGPPTAQSEGEQVRFTLNEKTKFFLHISTETSVYFDKNMDCYLLVWIKCCQLITFHK